MFIKLGLIEGALKQKDTLRCVFEGNNLLLFQLFPQDIRELVWYAVAETRAFKTLVRSVTHAQHALLWPQKGKIIILIKIIIKKHV